MESIKKRGGTRRTHWGPAFLKKGKSKTPGFLLAKNWKKKKGLTNEENEVIVWGLTKGTKWRGDLFTFRKKKIYVSNLLAGGGRVDESDLQVGIGTNNLRKPSK